MDATLVGQQGGSGGASHEQLLVRDNAMVMCMEHIRLIITADKVRPRPAWAGTLDGGEGGAGAACALPWPGSPVSRACRSTYVMGQYGGEEGRGGRARPRGRQRPPLGRVMCPSLLHTPTDNPKPHTPLVASSTHACLGQSPAFAAEFRGSSGAASARPRRTTQRCGALPPVGDCAAGRRPLGAEGQVHLLP